MIKIKKSGNIYFEKRIFLPLRLFFEGLAENKIMSYFSLKILSQIKPEKHSFGLQFQKDTLSLQIDPKVLILYWSSNKIK